MSSQVTTDNRAGPVFAKNGVMQKMGSDLLIWQINTNEKWNVNIKDLTP